MLGVICNDEDLLTCAINEVSKSLQIENGDQNDGIGVGYFSHDDPLLRKKPSADTNEIDYTELVKDIYSNVLLIHIGKKDKGVWKDSNTQPFRFRRWLFAHVGELPELIKNREKIEGSLPNFLMRNIKGDTDSELAFHIFLDTLYKENDLNDLGLGAEKLATHLQTCVDQLDSFRTKSSSQSDLCIMATNGQVMATICRGISVHYSHREGILECPLHEQSEQQLHLHGRFRGIMLGAAMQDPGHQWREVSNNSILSVSKSLELKVDQL
jgi:glutamine amidotransferase